MRMVVALGGNALLQRKEPMTAEAQLANIRIAAIALADLAKDHQIIITHGNGPQVGLLELQAAAYAPNALWPFDVLGAETQGMIGYQIEQELMNALPKGAQCATLVTRIEVSAQDPAFEHPTKPIGPVYAAGIADAATPDPKWNMIEESKGAFRRVVASPKPVAILNIAAIRLLVKAGICVICAGGGGIPVVRDEHGMIEGVEAVIDKDRTAALLAQELKAEALLILTDVEAVFLNWHEPNQQAMKTITPDELDKMSFAEGSMAPKIAAACAFVRNGKGIAGIGRLQDARAIIEGHAGTRIIAAHKH